MDDGTSNLWRQKFSPRKHSATRRISWYIHGCTCASVPYSYTKTANLGNRSFRYTGRECKPNIDSRSESCAAPWAPDASHPIKRCNNYHFGRGHNSRPAIMLSREKKSVIETSAVPCVNDRREKRSLLRWREIYNGLNNRNGERRRRKWFGSAEMTHSFVSVCDPLNCCGRWVHGPTEL